MGYLFKGKCRGGTFYKPQWLYDGGINSRLPLSARSLLDFFYRVLNRTGSPYFLVSESVIEHETALTPKTIRAAREALRRERLIDCYRVASAGAPFVFILLNPETKEPFPHDGKLPANYDPERRKKMGAGLRTFQKVIPDTAPAPATPKASEGACSNPPQNRRSHPDPVNARPEEGRKPEQACSLHGSNTWQLPDGTPRCGICHPNPNQPNPIKVPTRAEIFGA